MNTNIDEEWFTICIDSKLEKKIEVIEGTLHQYITELQHIQTELSVLKGTVESIIKTTTDQIKTISSEIKQLRHSHESIPSREQLFEELRILQQRELNLMLRDKKATPFVSSKSKNIML